jgi:hypothetical protein
MRIQIRVRDAAFQPVDDAAVEVEIVPVAFGGAAAGRTLRLTAEAAGREPGLYEIDYVPRLSGGFRAVANVRAANGGNLGRAEAGWSTDLAADEFRSLAPNLMLLEELARRTGGRTIAAEELDALAQNLPRERAPQMEAWSTPAWHNSAVFALALALLLAGVGPAALERNTRELTGRIFNRLAFWHSGWCSAQPRLARMGLPLARRSLS